MENNAIVLCREKGRPDRLTRAVTAGKCRWIFFFIGFLLFFSCAQVLRAESRLGVDVHDEPRSEGGWIWLTPHARVVERTAKDNDEPRSLVANDALAWQRRSDSVLNVGYGTSEWWIHVPLRNHGPDPVDRIVEIAEPIYDDLRFWVLQGEDVLVEAHMGDRVPFASRPIKYRHPSMRISVPPYSNVDLLIRANAYDGEHDPLPLRLWRIESFQESVLLETLAYGAYYGAILILLLYNLLIFISTRERGFFWYAVYLTSFLAWNFTFRGFGFQYVWPAAPEWSSVVIAVLVVCVFLSLTIFTWVLLDLRRNAPWLFRLSAVLAVLAAVHVAIIISDRNASVFTTLNPVGLVLMFVLLVAAARIALCGNVTARIYVAGIGCMYAGTLPYFFVAFGVMPASQWSIHAINVGSVLEFLLFALALAYRINNLKSEKLQAEQMAYETLRRSALELEDKVRNRTSELELANRSLHELAVRDALTGVFNRRHFNEVVQQELARTRRQEKPLALLLLDLDHFKMLNDLAGHQAGDEALKSLGELLASFSRRSVDQAFRIGGEEFAVLSVEVNPDRVYSWAEDLRLRIQSSAWPHPAPGLGRITASIGLAISVPGDTLETLYARADRALYRAKQNGRNQVAVAAE